MIPVFLYALAGGMLIVLATGRVDQLAWRFLQLIGFLVLAMTVTLTLWIFQSGLGPEVAAPRLSIIAGSVAAMGAMLLALGAPLASRSQWAFSGSCLASGGAALTAACSLYLAARGGQVSSSLAVALGIANQVLGAGLLGSITIAWLLGHAYLTATKMTIAPLRHFSRLLSWAVGARFVFLVASVVAAMVFAEATGVQVIEEMRNAWIVVLLRVGLGIVAVAIFAYMVADCVKLRATQSATGILYFGSLFAYVGELASQQLMVECGWPL